MVPVVAKPRRLSKLRLTSRALRVALGWDDALYARVLAFIRRTAFDYLDKGVAYSLQSPVAIWHICKSARKTFPQLPLYDDDWHIKSLLRRHLDNSRKRCRRARRTRRTRAVEYANAAGEPTTGFSRFEKSAGVLDISRSTLPLGGPGGSLPSAESLAFTDAVCVPETCLGSGGRDVALDAQTPSAPAAPMTGTDDQHQHLRHW
ncbi:hypothetical protein AURDEDRAFT_178198 [Auricularia subglabra TFB-10046 SS5]|uniref:Uncharacterized protein n=1 Tax=Auricularia subglabra (strain TFB-10046 / SS5) TaxID=717982 RepID=J0CR32_AURST|nr:hypothetical protein AURDEDRAFT_178198 [Auricularia subglabra TFB-10046 SS5]